MYVKKKGDKSGFISSCQGPHQLSTRFA